MTSRACSAVCVDSRACRAPAVRGSDPARCEVDGRATSDGGRGPGVACREVLERSHGCTIDAVIDDLYRQQVLLSERIDRLRAEEEGSGAELTRLLRIHGQNATRLGRLLRDRRALSGEAADGILGAVAQALDELSNEWGSRL